MDISQLADQYINQDQHVKELEEELKVAKAAKEETMNSLAEAMTDEEMQSINKRGKTLYLAETISVTVPAENKDALITALKKQGYGELIRPNVSSQTLTALVKELSGDADIYVPEWLEGIVNLYRAPKVNIRKSK
jgi:prophage DNA circulation protein